jgi:radical SAM-linked protein
MIRVRVHYKKGEALQYVANLDLHRIWERTFRRAQIPLAYSQGFHPQPRMHQACPLPLGFTSRCEMLDFWCDPDLPLDELQSRLVTTVQPGIEIQTLEEVPLKSTSLQAAVETSLYRVTLNESVVSSDLEETVEKLVTATTCPRERRGKPYDLRALIKELRFEPGTPPAIEMRLLVLPGATGRPEEVLDELGINPFSVDVERLDLTLLPEQVID